MKNLIISSFALLLAATNGFAQNNVQLIPNGGNVCNPMLIFAYAGGNSFNPISYLWSTGETSQAIEILSSGTYTVTVTGYSGNNSTKLTSVTKSGNYNVLPQPDITALTELWVCKDDTVRLQAPSGYDYISWSDGTTGELFEKKMNTPGIPGTPSLDTMSVSYTAGVNQLCSSTSQTVLLRAIRKPNGVGRFYQNKMNIQINDSIPAGLVLEYLHPVTYEMSFTEIGNPLNIIKYVTLPGSMKAPASMLTPGSSYSVETTPIINGQTFCSGLPSIIGLAPPAAGNKLGLNFTKEDGMKAYRIYDSSGRLLMERQAEEFNREWLTEIAPQMLIIQKIGKTNESVKIQTSK